MNRFQRRFELALTMSGISFDRIREEKSAIKKDLRKGGLFGATKVRLLLRDSVFQGQGVSQLCQCDLVSVSHFRE